MEQMLSILGYFIVVIFLMIFLKSMIYVVDQKTCAVVEVFGKFSKVSNAGLNFKLPYPIAQIANTISLQINQSSPVVTVKSVDNAFLSIPVKAQFRVIESKVKEAVYELDDPTKQISSYVVNKLRAMAAKYTMNELFTGDNTFAEDIKKDLNDKFFDYGYEIVDLLIDDPQPSESLKTAFDEVLASERKKDAAKNLADALKIELIGQALAEKASLELKGEAFVKYRNTIAAGNKNALEIMKGKKLVKSSVKEVDEEIIDKNNPGNFITHKVKKVVEEYVPNEHYVEDSNITDLDILNFFAGVDHREALRSVGKQGNLIISTNAPEVCRVNSDLDLSKIIGLIKKETHKS